MYVGQTKIPALEHTINYYQKETKVLNYITKCVPPTLKMIRASSQFLLAKHFVEIFKTSQSGKQKPLNSPKMKII